MVIAAKNSCTTVAVDFDGTVFDRFTNEPFEHSIEALEWFRRWGYKIVIFSARASTAESITWMTQWLNEKKACFDAITNVKPDKLTWLIDDRGIYFNNQSNNWLEITESIKKETFPWKK